jgi:cell division protein FtsI (penicillin-binding protein 3)
MRGRFAFVSAVLVIWAFVVVARLAQVQLARHAEYVSRATKQQERTVSLTPLRGSILDAKGRILAESVDVESIYADPQRIADWREAAARLAEVKDIGASRAELERRLQGRGEFAWIARQVTAEVARNVRALHIDGIYFLEEHRRSYPKGDLAASVIGYVGVDGSGLAGVEYGADEFVNGRPGKVTLLRDARRGMYMVGGEGANAPTDGNHVVLTIDEVVQFIAERAVERAVTRWGAHQGTAIVMNPSDGAVLAMASYPGFDPNRFGEYTADRWRNRAIHDLYEPGSTFKIVTAAAALEEGLVTPSQVIDCSGGSIEISANKRIREHDGLVFGLISFEEVMAKSSNVGTVRVGLSLGQQRMYRWIQRFGFGAPSGIDLPGEAAGLLRPTQKWSKLSNATIAIGQEIGVTPLQLLRATAAVANGGMLVEPRIVDRIVDRSGRTIHQPKRAEPQRVISVKTATILNDMLKTVVARGTGGKAALAEHVVAGKTGTAQKAGRGGYLPNRTVASFVGYAPADRPRIAILVVIDDPRRGEYGGTVAAPAFREIAEGTLRYLRVEPSLPNKRIAVPEPDLGVLASREAAGSGSPVPDLIGLDARAAVAAATAAGYRVRSSGGGVVVSQQLSGEREIELVMHSSPAAGSRPLAQTAGVAGT